MVSQFYHVKIWLGISLYRWNEIHFRLRYVLYVSPYTYIAEPRTAIFKSIDYRENKQQAR